MSINSKKLLVMRGVPGAGKSTYLSKTAPNAVVCSADHFFVRADGKYVFEAAQLQRAHETCFSTFIGLIANERVKLIAVDNTNLTWWEAGRYIEAGLTAGYDVEVVDVRASPEVAAARNVHGVPVEHIQKMARKQIKVPDNIKNNPAFKYTLVTS